MKIVSGSASLHLGKAIGDKLGADNVALEIKIFPDGEKRVRILQSVLDEKTVIIQSAANPPDEGYMELFFIMDAVKRGGAKSITVVVPYLGYQRQDHMFREGEAVSLQVIISMLEKFKPEKVITFDLHSIRIPALFNVPVRHLSALPLFAEKIKEIAGSTSDNSFLVSPDMGGIRRIKILSDALGMTYASVVKNRDLSTGSISSQQMEGEIKERAYIVDDMISTGETIVKSCELLKSQGVKKVYAFATHAIFSKEASRILQSADIEKVYVTDTIEVPEEKRFAKLEIISVAEIIAEEITQLATSA